MLTSEHIQKWRRVVFLLILRIKQNKPNSKSFVCCKFYWSYCVTFQLTSIFVLEDYRCTEVWSWNCHSAYGSHVQQQWQQNKNGKQLLITNLGYVPHWKRKYLLHVRKSSQSQTIMRCGSEFSEIQTCKKSHATKSQMNFCVELLAMLIYY